VAIDKIMAKIEESKSADSNDQYKIETYKDYAEYLKKPKEQQV
jgi:hypothetical protein